MDSSSVESHQKLRSHALSLRELGTAAHLEVCELGTADNSRMHLVGMEAGKEVQLVVLDLLRAVRHCGNAVCLAFGCVVSIICTAVALVEIAACLFWSLISIIFCVSKANGGTAFVLTDGSIMMQEFIGADLNYLGIGLVGWGTNRWWKLTPDESPELPEAKTG